MKPSSYPVPGISCNDTRKLLENLQANILKHHGRTHAWHIFIEFNSNTEQNRVAASAIGQSLTSAYQQYLDSEIRKKVDSYDGGVVKCLFLSRSGYESLGIPEDLWPYDSAFKQGMKKRGNIIHDPAFENWEIGYQGRIDAMMLIADASSKVLEEELKKIRTILAGSARILQVQKGEILRSKDGFPIEHFGYVDGISQPEFLKESKEFKSWRYPSSLSLVLTRDIAIRDTSCFGSYLVFRKLEQNVEAFKKRENELGKLLFPSDEDKSKRELAGAYVIGRFENSTPVVKHSEEGEIGNENDIDNDFDYSTDNAGSRCPYFAHMRMMNPRKGNMDIPGYFKPGFIVRRGITYDEVGRNGDMNWYPAKGVGLLFMAYQSSILNGFERMQQVANLGDGLIGQTAHIRNQYFPLLYGDDRYKIVGFAFGGYVNLKGGEYFFAPSIPFFRSLNSSNVQ